MELAGEVEAVGRGRDRVRGRRRGLRHRRASARTPSSPCKPESAADRAQAGGHELRGGCRGLRRRVHRAVVPAERGPSARARACSSTAPRARSEPRRCSSPSTSARTSPPCATRRTSSSCARSEPTGDRLHARGLHEGRRCSLRRHLRRGRQDVVQAMSPLAEDRRAVRARPTSGSCGTSRCSRSRRSGSETSGCGSAWRSTRRRTSSSSRSSSRRGEYRAVIDRTYPLEDVVEATAYVETGQKTGNVVLTVSHNGSAATR